MRTNPIKPLARIAFRVFFGLAARLHWYWPFVKLLTSVIEVRKAENVTPASDAFTLLALTPEAFRRDLDVLIGTGRVRILQVPSHWQTRLMYLFYELVHQRYIDINPAPGSKADRCKRCIQRFYRGVLPHVYARLGVDCVISSHMRWPADADWGIASKSIGVPYVVLYREGLFASSADLRKLMPDNFERWGKFEATHLVVHNESGRRFCIDSGYVDPERVSSLGCLRMDDFIRRIRSRPPGNVDGSKKIVLFPPPLSGDYRIGMPLFPVVEAVHVGLARLARRRPDLEVVFKPKAQDFASWCEQMDHVFREEKLLPDKISNLIVDARLDAQELILGSTVVCGFNTTTVLEAGIAGKPVVVPFFRQMRQPEFVGGVKSPDALQYLDVADDPEHFIRLIEQRLEDPSVSAENMAGRARMFEKYISNPNGGAAELYTDLFERLIGEAREGRAGARRAI